MTKTHLLLLHGALGSQQQLERLKTHLSAHFDVDSLNFEGHGGRAATGEFSIDRFAQNVIDYMTEAGIESAHIFGYSMGGYVGLRLAGLQPELVQSIVTFGTKFNWTPEAAAKETRMLNPDVIAEKVPRFAQHLEATHAPNDWKEVLHHTAQMMVAMGNGERLHDSDLQSVQQPVLIGIGTEDNMVTIAESEQAAQLLPHGQLRTMEGFQHPIERNDAEAMAGIIRDFISGQ